MKSFRVVNAKFRILKGGKIGLSLSISLVVSSLIFFTTKANAVDYFTDVQISTGTATNTTGSYDITVQTATNGGSLDSTRTLNDTNPVVFKPTSWANSSYTNPTFAAAETTPTAYPARYYLGSESFSPLELNLTFDTGATSGSISKNSTTFYSANITPSSYIVDNPGIPTQNLTSTVSNDYTANLIFEGSNTVSGSTNIGDGNIKINGSVDFAESVNAGSITVDTTHTTTFSGNVSLSSGSGTLNFIQDGDIILNSNFSGNITTTTGNGKITTIGTNVITGDIGAISNFLTSLHIGDLTTISNTTINGDVFVDSTILNNTITNSSTLILANDKNITSTITTSDNNKGILTLSGGTQTVTGQVGEDLKRLAEINAGYGTTFSSDVYSTNLDVEGTGEVALNGNFAGTAINFNEAGTVTLADGKNINSAITSDAANQGTLNLTGTSTISGQVGDSTNKLNTINANGASGKTVTFSSDVYSTNLDVEGTGEVALNGNFAGTAINFNEAGTVTLADGKNINSAITSDAANQGTLNLTGTSTISGQVGDSTNKLNTINANGASGKTVTFSSDVYATTTNIGAGEIKFVSDVSTDIVALSTTQGVVTFVGDVSGKSQAFTGDIGTAGSLINTLNIGESGTANYSTTTITGNVYATNTVLDNGTSSSTLILSDGSNITSTIKTAQNGQGILTFLGDSTVNGIIGTNTEKLEQINAGDDGKTVTFNSSINSNNLNILGDGEVILADNSNLNARVTTSSNNEGTLTLKGTSNVSGQIGTSGALLKEITLKGSSGEVVTFGSDIYVSNIVFESDGTTNLDGNLTGNINFSGINAIINVADGKGILDSGWGLLGSVQTLANNTGILNYKGDGVIDGIIGSSSLGINELNVNTNDEQDKDGSGTVTSNGLLARREIFADIINLYNNATLTLADNANVTNTDTSDSLIIATMTSNTGNVVFQGSSTVSGDVGTSTNNLESITAGVSGETVTFDGMVYATNLKYSDNGKVILNGDNGSNVEGMKGTVDFGVATVSKPTLGYGKLEIGDDVNLTTGTSGIQFANANNAILTFNGTSTIYGVLGGNTAGNSTFGSIYAGVTAETVTFKNDVYVKESTFHVSEDGVVNFEGNLYGNLVFENNGILNIANTKSIIVSSVPTSITTLNNGQGTVNFEGTTNLYTSIGTENFKLNNVTFASTGNTSNIYNQDIDKNVYALNTYIGNGSNKTTLNIKEDITFGGNLNLRKDSVLNVSDYNVTVDNNLNIASNSTLNFKVNATDLEGLASSTYGNYGSINSTSLTIDNDSEIHISYVGTLNGTDTYDLIRTSNIILTNYEGTELNGLVSDDSIVNSIVKNVGNNLVLFVDRTGGGSFAAEDLYIEKSGIGKDYSNGASRSLVGYAKEQDRAGALTDIVRKMEYLEGGTVLSEAKKQEMIETQRKLAPIANSSNMQ
ncbi:MAG: hypothetical protein RBR70_09265, partial [Arcobacter sp.]|uniref:beta strand repeat-containing protein n=1 Tax=Arcobacter sp. TaxID=1872629 RepID=UPI002A759B7A